ncbi:MAG: aminotransferase class I/II-fold pyridoxal phosphate-dependent enzyme [Actinomycetota bacterium]
MGIPAAGAHGGDGPAVAQALGIDVLDLSQTLNPFAPDAAVLVAAHASVVSVYPDPHDATVQLAETIGVEPGRLLLTNGGSEAIALVAAELGGGVASEPEFALHPRGDGAVWRSDPHNPSGRLAEPDARVDVWDEAFYPLATGRWHGGRPGVTVGSLTKLFACPGLRLGYLIADDVERYAKRQSHWAVSSLALASIPDLLAAADLVGWAAAVGRQRAQLVEMFENRGMEVDAAEAPWVLVRSVGLRDRLAPHGVVVRDCASFAMPDWCRVAVADNDGLDRLAAALDAAGLRG